MSNSDHQDDLDLLLSLQDRILETPPASPSSHSPGYLSDDGIPRQTGPVDMSVFRDAVKDCVDYDHNNVKKSLKLKQEKSSKETEVEKFSGLRIRDRVVSTLELSNHLSDIRFIRLPAIKNSLTGDTLTGCWATIGILMEKGLPRTSSIGQKFAIWKMGCLDDNMISLFLFGDAFEKNRDENVGTAFALFNCNARKDKSKSGFSLSIYSSKHMLKVGASADIGFCKGKQDGMNCTSVINIRRGAYCNYHKQNASSKYVNTRAELKGGNLRTGFRNHLKSEGIYVVNPESDRPKFTKSKQPMKLLSVEGLKKALSKADKVTTNAYSQGLRFLTQVAGINGPKETKEVARKQHQPRSREDIRLPRSRSQEPEAKKMKTEQKQAPAQEKKQVMIELDFISSDEEL